jgi:hypothetical protein
MDIIYCAGGNQRLANIAIEEGFLYGARSDDIRKLRCNGLIDINWKKYDWTDFVTKVNIHRPKYAVIPDILNMEEIGRANRQGEEILAIGSIPILVPKINGAIHLLPKKFVIGISVPTKYAGFLPQVRELKGRTIHLLGGSPPQQREVCWYLTSLSIKIGSADINSHSLASDFGSYWNGKRWYDKDRDWIGKYEAFRRSCKGIIAMWKELEKGMKID